jgi:hypothetical protein
MLGVLSNETRTSRAPSKKVWLMAAALSMLVACEEIPSSGILTCASLDDFAMVSPVLERRCGTLDCHGEYARPLRIMGQNGLRFLSDAELLDPGLIVENDTVTGGKGTTPEEVEQNWRSVCGLEPERTSEVVRSGDINSVYQLMLLRKPLQQDDNFEKHKGGQLLTKGLEGEVCISCWLVGFPDDVVCGEAIDDCKAAVASGTL